MVNIVEKKLDGLVKEKLQDLVEKGDIEIKNKNLISNNQNSNTENTEMEKGDIEIKNKILRKKIESIYTNQEERISGMHKITGVLAQDILKWFDEKENEFNEDVKISQVFNTLKNQKLKNLSL